MRAAWIFLALMAVSFANTAAETAFEEQTAASPLEIARNWQVLAILGIIISIILVAIAYMIGSGFEMPEITAWAKTELVQVVVNALIVAFLLITIASIEIVVIMIAQTSNIPAPSCYLGNSNSTSCLQDVTNAYLEDYTTTAAEGAKDVIRQNMDAAGWAGRRFGLYCLTIFCAQIGVSMSFTGHFILKSDMYAIIFEYYTNLLSSMEAQRFFVREICFKMGPVILAIGIVARTFFFTRRIGGLLMAIAIGAMFFFPGMYIFDWLTLDFTMTGDKAFAQEDSTCPAECGIQTPLAIVEGGGALNNTAQVYGAFSDATKETGKQIIDGTIASAVATVTNTSDPLYGKTITSCYWEFGEAPLTDANGKRAFRCPQPCRELPYPNSDICTNYSLGTQKECAKVPDACKVKRYVVIQNQTEYDSCPDSCKVVPPLKSDCDLDGPDDGSDKNCLDSSLECRQAHTDDLSYRPTRTVDWDDSKSVERYVRCAWASDCPASLTATESCVYVVPPTGRCVDLCGGCPVECRLDTFSGLPSDQLPPTCVDPETGNYWAACTSCPEGCKVRYSQIEAKDAAADANGSCTSCPLDKRIIWTTLPPDYTSGDCSLDACRSEYREVIPRNACDMCLFTEESYAYKPPINTQCDDACRPSDNTPASDPSAYTKIGESGLVGVPEIQQLSKLMVPGYVLPLFNIVATLVFIKGLSGFLGGDIEIPGLSKIF